MYAGKLSINKRAAAAPPKTFRTSKPHPFSIAFDSRSSSLIGAVEVKLLLLSGRMGAPAGHSLLFAVGAGPPHDGVRKARRLNLSTTLPACRLQVLDF